MDIATHAITDLRSLKAVIKIKRANGTLGKGPDGVEELMIPTHAWINLLEIRLDLIEPDYLGHIDGVRIMADYPALIIKG